MLRQRFVPIGAMFNANVHLSFDPRPLDVLNVRCLCGATIGASQNIALINDSTRETIVHWIVRTFREVFASFLKILGGFGPARTCLDTFECIRMCLDIFGCVGMLVAFVLDSGEARHEMCSPTSLARPNS